jgi:phage terminase large subunit-like protein
MTAYEQLRDMPLPFLKGLLASVSTWRDYARPEQIPPDDWRTWYVRGGRGSGKTWTGGNTLAEMAQTDPGEYGVVAPTDSAVRDVCIEGPSGLIHALGTNLAEIKRGASRLVASYNQSSAILRLRNGSVIYADGADDGAPTIQGKNLRGLWADEVGLWRKWQQAWEESIRYAVRLSPARIVATGTPKRGHQLVRALMADDAVHKSLLKTSDNAANLDPRLLAELYATYGGTTLGRQELEGEIIDDVPGALWSREMIQYRLVPQIMRGGIPETYLSRVAVAIDPAITSGESSDETGIIVAGVGHDRNGYVLADLSGRHTPLAWARRAVAAFHDYKADFIVAEANQGGDMVETTIRTIDPRVPIHLVHASRGKRTRAEPVSSLYTPPIEQRPYRVFHVEPFSDLEDQLCSYTGDSGEASPDRMDALVWGLTELMLTGSVMTGDISMVA